MTKIQLGAIWFVQTYDKDTTWCSLVCSDMSRFLVIANNLFMFLNVGCLCSEVV